MWIDATALLLIAVFVVFGSISGAMTQLATLAAAVATYFVAPKLGWFIQPWVYQARPEADPSVIAGASLVIAAIGFYLFLRIMIWLVTTTLKQSSEVIESTDRVLGGVIGFAKGALLVFLVCQGLFLVLERSPSVNDAVGSAADESIVMQTTRMVDLERLIRDVRGNGLDV